MPFEIAPGSLSGTLQTPTVLEMGGTAPTTVITKSQTWTVTVRWSLAGSLLPMLVGNWQVRLRFESFGEQAEFTLGPALVPLGTYTGTPTNRNYQQVFTITPAEPHIAAIADAAEYRLMASVRLVGPGGTPGPVAGFEEGAIVQIYQP